jgi:hypothetical protein
MGEGSDEMSAEFVPAAREVERPDCPKCALMHEHPRMNPTPHDTLISPQCTGMRKPTSETMELLAPVAYATTASPWVRFTPRQNGGRG